MTYVRRCVPAVEGLVIACSVLLGFAGCGAGTKSDPAARVGGSGKLTLTDLKDQVVDAACGECQFKMKGKSCDLAIRIEGTGYFVDGTKMGDHGDAHAPGGMCNVSRKAKVSGRIENGRFVASHFELLAVGP